MRAFETARLFMRPLGDGDEALYCRLYADPALMRHIAPVMSRESAQKSFRAVLRQQGAKRLVWVITEQATGAEQGILGLSPDGADAEVGVMLFADRQARGIATEVIPAVARELFGSTALTRLWTRHAVTNAPAAALMRNLGFDPLVDADVPAGEQRWQFTRERWLRAATRDGGESGERLECVASQD